ncbi:MAG: hypothetical protein LC737_08380 [Chloroflexi bacterium]|nr:hypothetical protein [Chloroflexota bacterium]
MLLTYLLLVLQRYWLLYSPWALLYSFSLYAAALLWWWAMRVPNTAQTVDTLG